MGGAIGGSKWAGRGAAIGATSGGIQGGIMGGGANRASMESRARAILHSNNLTAQLLSKGQTADGVIFLPAVQISSVKIVLAAGANPLIIELPVNLPAQDIPITIKEENPISE